MPIGWRTPLNPFVSSASRETHLSDLIRTHVGNGDFHQEDLGEDWISPKAFLKKIHWKKIQSVDTSYHVAPHYIWRFTQVTVDLPQYIKVTGIGKYECRGVQKYSIR